MRNKWNSIGLMLISILSMLSCQKKDFSDDPIPSHWLLPIAKGEFAPLDLSALNNQTFNFEIYAEDIGFVSGVPVSSPEFSVYDLGPYGFEINELIYGIDIATCDIEMTVTNMFPTAIKAGTKVSIKDDSTGTANVLTTLTLTEDIDRGATVTLPISINNKSIANKLYVYIDELKLAAFNNETFNEALAFSFHIKEISVSNVDIETNASYDINDTSDFDGATIEFDENDLNITDSTVNATITFKATNDLPINTALQIYFLDENSNVIDSIFTDGAVVSGATYSGSSFVSSSTSHFETYISKNRIEQIKNATQMVYKVNFNTNGYSGTYISVKNDQLLALKIIGDIKIILSPLMLDFL